MSCRRRFEKAAKRGSQPPEIQEGLYERVGGPMKRGDLALSAERIGAVNAVLAPVSEWDANGLKKLASSIAAKACDDRGAALHRSAHACGCRPVAGSRA
jgi:hypothetical protein